MASFGARDVNSGQIRIENQHAQPTITVAREGHVNALSVTVNERAHAGDTFKRRPWVRLVVVLLIQGHLDNVPREGPLGPPSVFASVNLVPLLWTGVPTTPSAPADRQDPLPIFRCPGNPSMLRRVFPDHLIT